MEHHGLTKNVARADQRSVLSFFFDDFLHVLQVSGTRWAQIETLSAVPAVESWEKLNKTWSIIAISINNEQWQHVSNLLLVVSSNFWLLDDFDASQKPLFVVRIVKGIGMNDRIEIWSWWLGVWVPQCIYFHAFRAFKKCSLADLKLLFTRHLLSSFQGLKSVSSMHEHLPRDK